MTPRAAERRVKDYTAPNRLPVDAKQCNSKYLQELCGMGFVLSYRALQEKKKSGGGKRQDDILALPRMGTAV